MKKYYLRFPGGKQKALTFSYDDGFYYDKQLVSILDKYGLRCTFNLNSGCFAPDETPEDDAEFRRLSVKESKKLYDLNKHEIASHGYSHPFLDKLPHDQVVGEMTWDIERLNKYFGINVRGMAYPYGTYNDDVIEVLKSLGIQYARAVESTHSFKLPEIPLVLLPTSHHDDENLFELGDKFINDTDSEPWMFYVWGHSFEYDRNSNWSRIEEFGQKMSAHNDVWYATNIEIIDCMNAYKKLEFTDKEIINPNDTEVLLYDGSETFAVPAHGKKEI